MDVVLQEGDDIQDIYKELSQTLQKDHLEIAKVSVYMDIQNSFRISTQIPLIETMVLFIHVPVFTCITSYYSYRILFWSHIFNQRSTCL